MRKVSIYLAGAPAGLQSEGGQSIRGCAERYCLISTACDLVLCSDSANLKPNSTARKIASLAVHIGQDSTSGYPE